MKHTPATLRIAQTRRPAGFTLLEMLVAAALCSVLLLALWTLYSTFANLFDRGQALYENHCQHCHEGWAHTRDGRVVDSLDGLRLRVSSWSMHAGLHWGDEEIDDVTRYLNRRFYQLDE